MKQQSKENVRQTATPSQETPQSSNRARRKKKYIKPDVVYQAPLEAMAATCSGAGGKVSGVCGNAFS